MSGTVIVTGGGGVIGRAICARLAESGYRPVAADLESSVPEASTSSPTPFVVMDVTSTASVQAAVTAAVPAGGGSRRDRQLRGHPA